MNNLQEDRKRDSDLEFLQRCKDSDLDTLLKMLRDHTSQSAIYWRARMESCCY